MINSVVLVGRLVREPELKYTQSNVAVATFTIAVNRRFKNANGEREADFINCVIWRQSAENLTNWATKGALIGVTGAIQVRNYENQQGQRVYVTEVIADNFQLLESREARTNGNASGATQTGQGSRPQNNVGNNGGQQNNRSYGNSGGFGNSSDPFANNGATMEISDDDLPF